MSSRQRRYPRRTDLFLIRVWTGSTLGTSKASGGNDGSDNSDVSDANGKDEWSGTVQRVVDGEARLFEGWQSLIDTLQAMVSDTGNEHGQ